ncbi:MAG TPA: hypothetical protein VGR31_14985 [Planctomycetota bacterium]|jgi:hypothetical protein|nr:hypothetical protein [Planctomycetota bacterium]
MHVSRCSPQGLRFSLRIAACLTLIASVALANHKDERLGFTIQTPNKWTAIPMSGDERWMVAKYLSDKSYFWEDKKEGWPREHKPDMEVVAFVDAAVKEKAKLVKKEARNGRTEWFVGFESPFKDYKDFMTKRYSGGGWSISDEKQDKVGDIPVTCYQIKVDKGSYEGPKHIITWVYHVPDVDIAVQFEALEDAWPKLQAEFVRCLRSFKATERSGEALYETSTGSEKVAWVDEQKLTPEQRKSHRAAVEKDTIDKATAKLTEGWTAKRMGHFFVLNHADEKFAKRVVDQGDAVWGWLDDTFGFVGEGEYVRSPILRICKDYPEYKAYFKGGNAWSRSEFEIVTYQDDGGSESWMCKLVNGYVLDFWLVNRDRTITLSMPGWLGVGLSNLVQNLHVKNGKVTFRRDDWDRDEVREAARTGKTTDAKEIFVMSGEAYWQDYVKSQEAGQLVDFLAARGGAKDRRTKDLLPQYMRNLQAVIAEVTKEEEAAGGKVAKKPKTEEEEDAWFKETRQGMKKKEQRILEDTFKRTFADWKDSDWKAFEASYDKAVH